MLDKFLYSYIVSVSPLRVNSALIRAWWFFVSKKIKKARHLLKKRIRVIKKKAIKHSRSASRKPKHKKVRKLFAQYAKKQHSKKHQLVVSHKKRKTHHHKIHSKLRRRVIAHHKVAPHMHIEKKLVLQIQRPPVVFIKPDVNDLICRGYSPKEIVHKYRSSPADFALSYVHPKYLTEANFM